jgi:sugar phosphate isomerase/epimerase
MNRLSIEYIGVFGLPPVEFVNVAADLGCQYISTALTPMPFNPHGYESWSLFEDRSLRQKMLAAMRNRGVSISLGEGFIIRPGLDIHDRASEIDVMCELGARRLNVVSIEPDMSRTFDQCAAFAEMAEMAGCETTLEFGPLFTIPDLATALAALRHAGERRMRLVIDTLHLVRSGAGAKDIAALDSNLIGYVQLCDGGMRATREQYMYEARFERMAPGTGEMPLFDILSALPRHLVVGLELPLRAQAEAGVGPRERLRPSVAGARELLDRLQTGT